MEGYSGFKKKKSALGSTLTIVVLLHIVAGGGLVWLASTAKGREMLAVYKVKILNLPLPAPEAPPETPAAKPEEPAPSPSEEKPAEAPPPEPEPAPPEEVETEASPPEPEPAEVASEESPVESASAEASLEPPTESPGMEGSGGEGVGPGPAEIAGLQSGPVRLPGSGNPFAGGGGGGGGKGRRFSGYADLVTSEIQKYYKQPSDFPGGIRLAVHFQLRLDEEGRLLDYKLTRSSGNPRFDESALQALSTIRQLRPPPRGMSKILTVKFFPPTG